MNSKTISGSKLFSINGRIARLVGLSTVLTLGVLFLFISVWIFNDSKGHIENELRVTAMSLSNELKVLVEYVEFGGKDEIRIMLDRMKNEAEFDHIALYTPKGHLIVSSSLSDSQTQPVKEDLPSLLNQYHFSLSQISYQRGFSDNMEKKGILYLEKSGREVRNNLLVILGCILFIFILTMVVGVYISRVLQKEISDPLLQLVKQMDLAGKNGDYSIRIHTDSSERLKEVHELTFGFNRMISQIEAQDSQLKNSKVNLEDTVAHRTAELKQEIDKRLQYESELIKARDKAQAANKAKTEFLAVMSHEIRTPMNGILGMATLVNETELNREQKEYVESILSSGNSLITLINDILDFSRIESEKMDLGRVDFSIEKVMLEVFRTFKAYSEQKELEFICDLSEATALDGVVLIGDPARTRQILMNLVGNAMKFTSSGVVSMNLEVDSARIKDQIIDISIHVKDTGIGISADKVDQIFQPFQQADYSTTRKFGGSGLGLSICQRIVELMGGSIEVSSIPGQGSIFSIHVPLPCRIEKSSHKKGDIVSTQKALMEEASSQTLPNDRLTILLAEDHPTNQKLATRLLEKRGHKVLVANDGREAISHLPAHNEVDVILMDLHMPGMGGLEAIKKIREMESVGILNQNNRIPIIALTASVSAKDQMDCQNAGADDFVPKPLDINMLCHKIFEHHKKKQPAS